MADMNIVENDVEWNIIQKGVQKLERMLEGQPEKFSSDDVDCMMLYMTIYRMCTQRPHYDYSRQLYEKYREFIDGYIRSKVLPSLREKRGESMLRELVKRWSNHKKMVRYLSSSFGYLDSFVRERGLRSLHQVVLYCFRETVYQEIKGKARDAVIALIDKEREGEQIDRDLVKNVIGVYFGIGNMNIGYYIDDFENHMLADSAAYYSRKAFNWILEDSCSDYMLKVEYCLKNEKDRVANYLHTSSEPKLLEVVQHELLVVYGRQLLEKGCRTLLRDDKVDDLARMYRLFSEIPKGLDLVANIFKRMY